jgi:homospermidine synthase
MMHAEFAGPIVMLGFGSIGRGVLPLLERHIGFDRSKFVVIAPDDSDRGLLDERKLRFEKLAITKENYRDVLKPLLTGGPGRGMIVNLSVDTSSADLIDFCKDIDAFYIDTVCEPWPGLYTNAKASISERSNYALREGVLDVRRRRPGGVTAVSCCGANPGMVSWFVKQALIDIATELKLKFVEPTTREGWGKLMQQVGVKGIHIAERDTQRARDPKPFGKFINTWSVEGFCSEGLQPSELGWGTHEKAMPANGHRHTFGCEAAIYLTQPGAGTRVRSWTPTAQAQHGFLVTHNEAISIADYFTVREGDKAVYRPPLRLSPVRRRGAVATRDGRQCLEGAGDLAHPDRNRHRRRRRRARRTSLRPREKRLLVRLLALDRGDAQAGALPERDRASGHVRGARRHRVDAGEPGSRPYRSRRDGFPPLPGNPDAVSRPGVRQIHRLDAAEGPSGSLPGRPRHE